MEWALVWLEKVTGKHLHYHKRLPGEWAVYDSNKGVTYYNTACRCGRLLRVHSTGRVVVEPAGVKRGMSECFWPTPPPSKEEG